MPLGGWDVWPPAGSSTRCAHHVVFPDIRHEIAPLTGFVPLARSAHSSFFVDLPCRACHARGFSPADALPSLDDAALVRRPKATHSSNTASFLEAGVAQTPASFGGVAEHHAHKAHHAAEHLKQLEHDALVEMETKALVFATAPLTVLTSCLCVGAAYLETKCGIFLIKKAEDIEKRTAENASEVPHMRQTDHDREPLQR